MGQPRLTVAVPAFNEADHLPTLLRTLLDRYGDDPGIELLVVDDGSSDGTAAVARSFSGVRVVEHPYNQGNGAAVKSALRAARGEVMVIIDADGQHPPELIDHLVGMVGKYDLVVGARTSESDATAFRNFGNRWLARFASYLVSFPIPDLTSGFRAFKRPMMLQFYHLFPQGFSFPSTSTLSFIVSGYSVHFEPIVAARRQGGVSKIRPFKDGLRFMKLSLRLALLFHPSRFFLPLAGLLAVLGVAWGGYNMAVRHLGISPGALLLVMMAMMVLLMGVLAEQQSQILRQLSARQMPLEAEATGDEQHACAVETAR